MLESAAMDQSEHLQRGRHQRAYEEQTNFSLAKLPEYYPPNISISSPFLVPFDCSFELAKIDSSAPKAAPGKKLLKAQLREKIAEFSELQGKLYAHNRLSMKAVFQALDAGGKDGSIRAVTTGVNPAGFQVFNFKKPSSMER